jgi:hypothetical protein
MSDESHKDFLLSTLRAASLRARLMEVELSSVGVALKGNLVTVAQAITWLKDIGALEFVGMIPDAIAKEAANGGKKT